MNGFHKIEGGIFPYIYLIFKKLLKFYLLSMLCQEINLLENLRVKIFLLNSIQKKKKKTLQIPFSIPHPIPYKDHTDCPT